MIATSVGEAQQAKDQKATPVPQSHAASGIPMPDADKIVLLVRTTLLTFNDAIQTGNFTVLRERGSFSFRATNTAAELANSFSRFKLVQIDLTGIAITAPQLTTAPSFDAQNRLHLTGYFPGQPWNVNFDLLYEVVGGQWRLSAIAVNLVTPHVVTQGPPQAQGGLMTTSTGRAAMQRAQSSSPTSRRTFRGRSLLRPTV